MRKEQDFLGSENLPSDALYGLQSVRATHNFPNSKPFNPLWYKAIGVVKQSCYSTTIAYINAMNKKHPTQLEQQQLPSLPVLDALSKAAIEVANGKHFEHFIVPAITGGAGTSQNMNVNEIIANRALQLTGDTCGNYKKIDPIQDANIFQSTNDVIPTALRVAVMQQLNELEESINTMRAKLEKLEKKHRNKLRIAYTQMQEAVPSTFGQLLSTYCDALSRDWWRISKCNERIKQVNLGGSAIGSGITNPRFFVMEVAKKLQQLTNLPLTRAENPQEATANLDPFVEVHGMLKANAVNLEKMVADIRLLASDLVQGGITLPQLQIGSSIMPGKINPVIPEFVISSVHQVYANDQLITALAGQGCLDLNAYIPVIGNALLDSLSLLISCYNSAREKLFDNIQIGTESGREAIMQRPLINTALLPFIGYRNAALLSKHMKEHKCDVYQANNALKIIDNSKLKQILSSDRLLQSGFTAEDLTLYHDK